MWTDPPINAGRYKGNDIDTDGDGKVNDADQLDGLDNTEVGSDPVFNWTKDGDWNESGTNQGSYTLSGTYDFVRLVIYSFSHDDANQRQVRLQVNGDSSSVYEYASSNGDQTSGASYWALYDGQDRPELWGEVNLTGTWVGSDGPMVSADISALPDPERVLVAGSQTGGLNSPLDSMTIRLGGSDEYDMTAAVFGRDQA